MPCLRLILHGSCQHSAEFNLLFNSLDHEPRINVSVSRLACEQPEDKIRDPQHLPGAPGGSARLRPERTTT